MSQIVALKCPNCGGLVARNEMKCEYCGAELIALSDGSSFGLKNQSACPQCGEKIEASSWFCPNCSTILIKDIEVLRRLQKKVRFLTEGTKQEFLKKVPSSFAKGLEADEFFYMTLSREQGDNFFGVTNKRIIKFKDGEYTEIPLSDVVGVYPIRAKTGAFIPFVPIPPKVTLEFEVSTFNGIKKIDGLKGNPQYCGMFWGRLLLLLLIMKKERRILLNCI